MKFDDLDSRMRVFETSDDRCVLPGIYMVARLDGRSFTRLTKEVQAFEAPFDERFRDAMVRTVEHLMQCGFRVTYGYTESDEISLLLDRDETTFGRKTRKLISILAGEASSHFSLYLGVPACFDCRISQLPRKSDVVDYFRWRNEDAHRNALNAHCYWALRKEGKDAMDATKELAHLTNAAKNELLFQRGVNFNLVPSWQKRGVGVVWSNHEKHSTNSLTGQPVSTPRRRLRSVLDLPMRDEYSEFVAALLE
ncbi:tRNA(His) guanylyltransferase Thg1 family protein [Aeoliella sp. SH292]|uniref:tRNA(His) guanylyltransferase Thg1 family protein n=1 Tax=Aeoliella sp. SH292 TaxID=3454464 RepID=UPI003F9AB16C